MSSSSRLHTWTQSLLSRQFCALAQLRRLQQQCRLATTSTASPSKTAIPQPLPFKPLIIPKKGHKPQPLSRPLGQKDPPQPGENTGKDTRTWRERRNDLFSRERYLARREEIVRQLAKPYFREWTALRDHKGKTFFCPRSIFKAEKALYFPNLRGYTLTNRWKVDKDTTDVFKGKVSLVALYSGTWAYNQTATFAGEKQNPELQKLLGHQNGLQKVNINFEARRMRAGLVWMFVGGLKKMIKKEDWDKYFVVRKGITDDLRLDIGFINVVVGYVYLVDWEGRIRWAGSGDAEEEERKGLVTCAKRLIDAWEKEKQKQKEKEKEAEAEAKPGPADDKAGSDLYRQDLRQAGDK